MKHALIAATLVLVGGATVGCGSDGGSGAPADASEKDFCASYTSLFEDMTGMTDATDKQIIAKIKDWGTAMQETGTPKDISDEARAGFETTMDLIDSLDEDSTKEEFQKIDEDLTQKEKDGVEAFDTYTTDTCGSPLDDAEVPEIPSETPTVPSETPSS